MNTPPEIDATEMAQSQPMAGPWRYRDAYSRIPAPQFRIPYISAQSPIQRLKSGPFGEFLIKREDLNVTGSHKERAACFQISMVREQGFPAAVISSSGNAAIAVSTYATACGMKILAFLSPETPRGKVAAIIQAGGQAIISGKPANFARYAARIAQLPNLRPSTDSHAVSGFMSLGFEICDQFPGEAPSAVFLFCTSGATMLGIARAFARIRLQKLSWQFPELHAVQSGKATDLADHFDMRSDHPDSDECLRGAGWGGIKGSPLIPEVIGHICDFGGSAWKMSDPEITAAARTLESLSVFTSLEGAACLAAVSRWRSAGGKGVPLVILTGRYYPETEPSGLTACPDVGPGAVHFVETYLDVRRLLDRLVRVP